jgi:hypothetical protein
MTRLAPLLWLVSALLIASLALAGPAGAQNGAADTDLDGLPNTWETNGVDTDADGRIDLDLPRFGANPNHRDVFVEIDSMRGHQLDRAAIDMVIQSFRQSPVPNPDGRRGVTLHVDNGPFSVMNPDTGERWERRSQSTADIAHQDVLGSFSSPNVYDWTAFDAIKRDNFARSRAPAFRYALSIHQYGSATNFSSGLARGIPTTDFFVSMGRLCSGVDCTFGTVGSLAGTFMHELGHTLGLFHGGNQDINYKPNYLSVMNYFWQFSGLKRRAESLGGIYDYSRTGPGSSSGTTGVVDENALREGTGVTASGSRHNFASAHFCRFKGEVLIERLNRAVDWSCNNQIVDIPFSRDITNDGEIDRLEPFNDWGIFNSTVPSVGTLDPAALPRRTPNFDRDATINRLRDSAQVTVGDEKRPALQVRRFPTRRGQVKVMVVATDNDGLDKLVVTGGGQTETVVAPSDEVRRKLEASVTVRRGQRVNAVVFDRATNERATTLAAK